MTNILGLPARLLCFSGFLLLSLICVNSLEIESSEDQLPISNEYKFHRRPAHGISDPGSPWITGPKNKKYQFHVGRQSWLAAREHCLGQNSDLVTISSQEELEWILGHYSPQFPNLKDRFVQIGLLIETHGGTREWHWVDESPLRQDILSWISGEPFDHAEGRERCGILRVNEQNIDDVDCDLPGSMTTMYRFVCERTHEEHVKHEEVNNPLWKKLQDILDFFGISGGAETENEEKNATKTGEGEEDYVDMMSKNTTTTSNLELNKIEKEETVSSAVSSQTIAAQSEDLEGSGAEDNEVLKATSAAPQAQGAKTLDKVLISDELLLNENLEKINEKHDSSEIKSTISPSLEDADLIDTTRTTKPDPLEKLSANKEKVAKAEDAYVDVLERNMEKLEKIVSAVEKMIDPLEGLDEEATPPSASTKARESSKKENKQKQEEELKPPQDIETSNTVKDAPTTFINNATANLNNNNNNNEMDEGKESEKDTVDAMEKDFDEAEHETHEHPDINSGDLVALQEHKENIESCEDENETEEGQRNKKIEKFLKTLHRFLNRSSAKDLKELVEESKQNGTSLLDRLNQSISKATEVEIEKMEKIRKTLNESLTNGDVDEKKLESPRENVISSSTSIIPTDEKGQNNSVVQLISNEKNNNNNNNNNENDIVESSTTVADHHNSLLMSTTKTFTTPENKETTVVDEKTSVEEKADNEMHSNNDDEMRIKNKNATTIDDDDDKKNSSKNLADEEEQGSTTKFAEKIEADETGEDKNDEKSHEVTLTIHLPQKFDNSKETESAHNHDVGGKDENNKSLEKAVDNKIELSENEKNNETQNIKVEPKSRADRLPSSKTDGSVFPTPRFDLLKPEELKQIPEDINKAIQKEAKKINIIYDDFNKRIDTSSLLKRIEESEKRRLQELRPLPLVTSSPKVTLAPSRDEAEKKAMRELEKLFEDLGKNFQQIVQG